MIVAVAFQFHDHEAEDFTIDTDKLGDTLFERDFKAALEGRKQFTQMDGEKYDDEWGKWRQAIVAESPQQARRIHVFWDC